MEIHIDPPIPPSVVPFVRLIFDKGEEQPSSTKPVRDMLRKALEHLPSSMDAIHKIELKTKNEK